MLLAHCARSPDRGIVSPMDLKSERLIGTILGTAPTVLSD